MPFQEKPLKEILIVTRRHELEKALDRTDDLMEPGRPKVIHARGAVSMIEFATDDHSPFTGILGPHPLVGQSDSFVMSLVAQVKRNAAYTPALALKLLIDGKPSADVLAMNHTVGQGRDFDVFSNTMTNDLSEEHKELRTAQRVMSVLFERVSEQPRRLVVTHLANQTKAGATVPDPVEPRRLVFHPTSNARQIFSGQAGVDFRLVLAGIPAGTELYEVEGLTDSGANTCRNDPHDESVRVERGRRPTVLPPCAGPQRPQEVLEAHRCFPVAREHPSESHRPIRVAGNQFFFEAAECPLKIENRIAQLRIVDPFCCVDGEQVVPTNVETTRVRSLIDQEHVGHRRARQRCCQPPVVEPFAQPVEIDDRLVFDIFGTEDRRQVTTDLMDDIVPEQGRTQFGQPSAVEWFLARLGVRQTFASVRYHV